MPPVGPESLGGFTAPMVARDTPLAMIVLVNAMIPLPAETPGEWWGATGSEQARVQNDVASGRSGAFDEQTHFLHDVDPAVVAAGASEQRAPSATPSGQPCAFERWPDVPVEVVGRRDDRFLPSAFPRRVARARLGAEIDDDAWLFTPTKPAGPAGTALASSALSAFAQQQRVAAKARATAKARRR